MACNALRDGSKNLLHFGWIGPHQSSAFVFFIQLNPVDSEMTPLELKNIIKYPGHRDRNCLL
jgi:hypothetical protein